MTTIARTLRQLILLLVLVGSQGVSMAQSLHDVVISISDRKRVVNQREQVISYLENQHNAPAVTDPDLPPDDPVDWLGVGTSPTQSAIEGLDIGGRIALLDQAVEIFDGLKFDFLNSSPDEFVPDATVGTLQRYENGDFPPLPRVTPENYHELLRVLAQKVGALRLIQWPAAFKHNSSSGSIGVQEVLTYDYETEQTSVEILTLDGEPVSDPVDWNPSSISNSDFDLSTGDGNTQVFSSSSSDIRVHGSYSEAPSYTPEITAPLRRQTLGISVTYPEEAEVEATAPGADGTPISGMVYLLRRSHWHEFDTGPVSPEYDKNEAGYVVAGASDSGAVALFNGPPSAKINGTWVATGSVFEDETAKVFVEGGYQHKAAFLLPVDDGGYSDDFSKSYESNWKVGCVFVAVFKPTFTRGVDAAAMRTALEKTNQVLARNTSDGGLLLHPRPSLLFGIDLGPGLKGGGEGCLSTRPMIPRQEYFGEGDFFGESDYNRRVMPRFDSSYSLQLAGSHSDYHVVHEKDRSLRSQSLPEDGMGWPYSDENGDQYDTSALYQAWDSPRLKQVAGRDLVADITYNANHYCGYTVKIHRRPTGSAPPTPGEEIDVSGMPLIRTRTDSRKSSTLLRSAWPSSLRKLDKSARTASSSDARRCLVAARSWAEPPSPNKLSNTRRGCASAGSGVVGVDQDRLF